MHVSEFDALWREYVAAFGELLRPAEYNAQSAASRRLVSCAEEAWQSCPARRLLHLRVYTPAVIAVRLFR
jgi:hypothetical protein